MTIFLKDRYLTHPKLDIKKIISGKISSLIREYRKSYDIESLHFNTPIDGILYVRTFIHYSDEKFVSDWYFMKGSTLLKVYNSLKEKDFYGLCKLSNDKYVKIKPKK
jgi:hypothetical protein